jgi:hypothetical protein
LGNGIELGLHLSQIHQNDAGAFLCEIMGYGFADAARAADNDCDLTAQFHVRLS